MGFESISMGQWVGILISISVIYRLGCVRFV